MSSRSRTGRAMSDYEQGRGGNTSSGPNDGAMAQKGGWFSNLLNQVTETAMNPLGFTTTRRTGAQDNDFYRDNAQYMPGYNIGGMPSGAWAQDRATNHVGHGKGAGNPWSNIRQGLVQNESARIEANRAAGGDGRIGFGDVYDAHVEEYGKSGGDGNQFIDPGSFALAVYGAPMLEAFGVDAGPITGASIDVFNDPEDSAFEGWAKRMGLGLGEVGLSMGLMMNPLTAPLGVMGMGLGVGGMIWNTATALGGADTANWMSDMASGALNAGGNVLDAVGNGIGTAVDAVGSGIGTAVDAVGSGLSSAADFVGDLFSW